MSSILGYINLLLVLIQPSPAQQKPVLQEAVMEPCVNQWVQPELPVTYFQQIVNEPIETVGVTHSNKPLLGAGRITVNPFTSLNFQDKYQLHNKRRISVKLFILNCQLKADLHKSN